MFTWDEPKRVANVQKHGLDFDDMFHFDWGQAFIGRAIDGRFKAIGYFGDRITVVIRVVLGSEAISIISFRPASA
jgi:uncharacterized protein